jgi:hypothetical protein
MPPVYSSVQAEVVDIAKDAPSRGDTFLVDSNVWYWLTYSKASQVVTGKPGRRQLLSYSSYVDRAVRAGAALRSCGLSLAELAHRIESSEHEIYAAANSSTIEAKEFRHNLPDSRASVVAEISTSWRQVTSMANVISLFVNQRTVSSAETRLATQAVDGYDLFLLEGMNIGGMTQLISDDGDFCTVPGLRLFTSNPTVIGAATAAGKLLRR